MREATKQGDLFANKEWVAKYDYLFAELYRLATYNWEIGNTEMVHPAWRVHFKHAEKSDLLIVQNLLLGVNAHILSDLCFALKMMNISSDQDSKHNDSTNVNVPIMEVYNAVLPPLLKLYAPVINLTRFEDEIGWGVYKLVATERERAWNLALNLLGDESLLLDNYIQVTALAAAEVYVKLPEWAFGYFSELKKLEGPNPVETFCNIFPFKCNRSILRLVKVCKSSKSL